MGAAMGQILSASSNASLNALNSIQAQMNAAQRRITTGKRVSSPIDDPAAFFTASGLTGRAASLNSLFDNMANAQNALTAASKAVTSIQSLLSSAQSIATQALQSADTLITVTGNNSNALTTSTTIASNGGSASRFRTGDTFTVSDGTTTATYTAANNDTLQTLLNAVNNTAGLKVTASLNSSGQIQLAATSGVNVTVGATMNGAGGATLNSVTGLTAGTTTFVANTARSSLASQFDTLRSQIDQAVQDAGYEGVNFLNGSNLSVAFNETGSSKLDITGATISASGLGMAASTGQFQTDTDINTAVTNITTAIANLYAASSTLGSTGAIMDARKEFNQSLVDIIERGADELTAADTNADSALLIALQTRQQLITTTLSITASSDRNALRLLAG